MINNIKNVVFNNIVDLMINKTFESSMNIVKISKKDSKYNYIDKNKSYLLYIHIPFCDNLCPFCTFHKYQYNCDLSNKYFENLREEIKILKSHNVKIDSIYVGGGSPLINSEEMIKTFKLLKELFNVEDVSCETDPNHIEVETLEKLKGLVKRLSLGIQSFDDTLLKQLGRYKKFGGKEELKEKIEKIVGILPILSIDLIFNIPNQTEKMLKEDIKILKSLGVDQIVTYPLMSTNLNTKFINRFTPNTNKEHFYNIINEELKDYNADNMWSFSKNTQTKELNDEYISQHNEYIGLGSGGFSYLKGNLFVNAYDLKKYEELIKTKKDSVYAKSQFKQKDIAKYYVLCTIFSGELKIKDYNQRFDIPLEKYLKKELFILKLLKIIYIKNDIIYVTKKGRHLLTIMMSGFYSQMDKVRALFKNQGHLFE